MHPALARDAGPRHLAQPSDDERLHDAASSRQLESKALAREAPHALMQRAGQSVARLARAVAPHARHIHVLAGPGNNGGDGMAAACALAAAGAQVRVTLLGDAARLPADAADAHARALRAGITPTTELSALGTCDLVIDALLGLGARRPPEGALAVALEALDHVRAPVLAVDLPSGLHPDTGTPLGPRAVKAAWTLSLLTLKPGLFTATGRDHAGDIWLDTLGFDAHDVPPTAWLAGAATLARALPERPHDSHKGRYGDVHVVGGAPGMTGAAWLAARAALAAGAGRVHVNLLQHGEPAGDPLRPELMTGPPAWELPPARWRAATVACGCGGGEAVAAALPVLLAHAGRLVLDADALNRIAADPGLQQALVERSRTAAPTLITPHPLEAARLLGTSVREVQADRLAAASRLCARFGCTVLLKGSGTVVCSPARLPTINPTGNAVLASPGTGDVLAGWAAGSWSAAGPRLDAHEAATAAAWLHGRAADLEAARRGGALPLHAADLVEAMRSAAAVR